MRYLTVASFSDQFFHFDLKFRMIPDRNFMAQVVVRNLDSKWRCNCSMDTMIILSYENRDQFLTQATDRSFLQTVNLTVMLNFGPSTLIQMNLIWFLKSEFRKNEPSESTFFNLPPCTTLNRAGFGRNRAAQMLFIVLFIVWFSK